MPELPEVQIIVNDLRKKVLGKRIISFSSDTPRIFPKNKISRLKRQIRGCRIQAISRRGKNILVYLTHSHKPNAVSHKLLVIHPKLTGRLELTNNGKQRKKWNINKYYRAIFYLNNGQALAFIDIRKFGKIIFGDKSEVESLPDLKNLGPDALDKNLDPDKFSRLIRNSKRYIKTVLLDQEIISGIGNIYSDESLWTAKINPFVRANKLKKSQLTKLYNASIKTLNDALKTRGSSMRDFLDTEGVAGNYFKIRKVYARENLPCMRCGAKIKRVRINVRSTHFCPRCQK